MEEIIELSDRVITVFHGSINGEFRREKITQDNLTAASFGLTVESGVHA
jgi:AI-2 transport system ATP-binding protein